MREGGREGVNECVKGVSGGGGEDKCERGRGGGRE